MLIAIDNGERYEDHGIYFVDLEAEAGHRYTIRDVEEIISILNPEKNSNGMRILFTAYDVTPSSDGILDSFSSFVFQVLHKWDYNPVPRISIDLKNVSVDLGERLKSDLQVEFKKYIKANGLDNPIIESVILEFIE